MLMKIEIGNKGIDMVEGMVIETKISREGPMGGLLLKLKHTTPPQRKGSPIEIHHLEEWVVDREMVMGMVKIRMTKIGKRYRDTRYDFEEKDEEESDTEDSFEFEITPQQLSQVTPGGGVLKIALSKKGPLRITTKAQSKKPDSSQTTIKTVYDPTKEERLLQEGENIKVKTTSRRGESLKNQRIKPREAPNDKRDEGYLEEGGPVRQINPGDSGSPDGNGGPDKGRKPPRKREEPPNGFRRVNRGGGGSDPSDDNGDGGGSTPPSSENTPPTRRKHRRPKFVYVLQGPPGPPGQVRQPGQAGRDGRDGQTPHLTKALEDALKTQKTSWDSTNLENSFDYFGRTMHEVL